MGSFRRGLLLQWQWTYYRLQLSHLPLCGGGGGGARATARKRNEKIATLANAVGELASQVRMLQQQVGGPTSPSGPTTGPPKKKKKKRKQNASLLQELLDAFRIMQDSRTKPTEAQTRDFLVQLLAKHVDSVSRSSPGSQALDNREPRAPQPSPKPPPASDGPRKWSDLFKGPKAPKPNAPDMPKVKPENFRLYAQAWTAPVVAAKLVKTHPLGSDLVVACQDEKEKAAAQEWIKARGYAHKVSFVTFRGADFTDSVLVHGKSGPHSVQAHVEKTHADAPSLKGLPQQFKDDEKPAAKGTEPSTKLMRVTIARDFADQQTMGKVLDKPHCLPAVAFPNLKHLVLQTRAALSYERETTCLMLVKTEHVEQFLKATAPNGVFCNLHKTDKTPVWFARKKDESSSDYWLRVSRQMASQGGRLVYRSSTNASLGLLEPNKHVSEGIAPRWYLSNAPLDWTDADAQSWITERGFTDLTMLRRQGRKNWYFRGHAPGGPLNITQAFVFKSGISIGAATTLKNSKAPTAEKQARSVWGAPAPPQPKPENSVTQEAEASPTADSKNSSAMEVETDGKQLHTPPKASSGTAAKKPKRNDDSSPPWSCHLTAVSNGGQGDCGFISIAQALQAKSGVRHKAGDFEPKGRLQAQLRVLASTEMKKNKLMYDLEEGNMLAEETLVAGTYAEAHSLQALCNASHLDLRIWGYDNKLKQWDFYQLAPSRSVPGKTPTVIYLKLEANHYEWLKPVAEIPSNVAETWLRTAKSKPPALSGGGKSLHDKDALAVLGLEASDTASASSRHALSVLGLKSVKSKANTAAASSRPKSSVNRPARSVLGLKSCAASAAGSTDGGLEDMPDTLKVYTQGDHLKCPCGWAPPAGKPNFQRKEAQKHWRRCQGSDAPPRPPDKAAHDESKRIQSAAKVARDKNDAAYKEWKREMAKKHPELKTSFCSPNLSVPFFSAKEGRRFPCTKCGTVRNYNQLRRFPCKKRPKRVSIRQFQVAIHGSFLDPGHKYADRNAGFKERLCARLRAKRAAQKEQRAKPKRRSKDSPKLPSSKTPPCPKPSCKPECASRSQAKGARTS